MVLCFIFAALVGQCVSTCESECEMNCKENKEYLLCTEYCKGNISGTNPCQSPKQRFKSAVKKVNTINHFKNREWWTFLENKDDKLTWNEDEKLLQNEKAPNALKIKFFPVGNEKLEVKPKDFLHTTFHQVYMNWNEGVHQFIAFGDEEGKNFISVNLGNGGLNPSLKVVPKVWWFAKEENTENIEKAKLQNPISFRVLLWAIKKVDESLGDYQLLSRGGVNCQTAALALASKLRILHILPASQGNNKNMNGIVDWMMSHIIVRGDKLAKETEQHKATGECNFKIPILDGCGLFEFCENDNKCYILQPLGGKCTRNEGCELWYDCVDNKCAQRGSEKSKRIYF